MAGSFGSVDEKVAEADFFLEKLSQCKFEFFEARCYFNAFVSAARSITFTLQAAMSDIPGFSDWYREKQEAVRRVEFTKFFVEARNSTQKTGAQPVASGTMKRTEHEPIVTFMFAATEAYRSVPDKDVVTACREYLAVLVNVVLDCYQDFGPIVDPDQYFTLESFAQRGLTIDDADEECYGVRGWTSAPGFPEELRWQALRDYVPGCAIDDLFTKYTDRERTKPERVSLPEAQVSRGWVLPDSLRVTGDASEDVRLFIASSRRTGDGD